MRHIDYRHRHFVSLFLMAGLALTQVSCQPACQKMEPTIICRLPTHRISTLPSAFPPLSSEERQQEWAKELLMGDAFAKECDFYRAITCYKRALILLPSCEESALSNYTTTSPFATI